jgi:hypothetical protein
MIPNQSPQSLSPGVTDDSSRQWVSLCLKLASIFEKENRRVDGFIHRLSQVNQDPAARKR